MLELDRSSRKTFGRGVVRFESKWHSMLRLMQKNLEQWNDATFAGGVSTHSYCWTESEDSAVRLWIGVEKQLWKAESTFRVIPLILGGIDWGAIEAAVVKIQACFRGMQARREATKLMYSPDGPFVRKRAPAWYAMAANQKKR